MKNILLLLSLLTIFPLTAKNYIAKIVNKTGEQLRISYPLNGRGNGSFGFVLTKDVKLPLEMPDFPVKFGCPQLGNRHIIEFKFCIIHRAMGHQPQPFLGIYEQNGILKFLSSTAVQVENGKLEKDNYYTLEINKKCDKRIFVERSYRRCCDRPVLIKPNSLEIKMLLNEVSSELF